MPGILDIMHSDYMREVALQVSDIAFEGNDVILTAAPKLDGDFDPTERAWIE